ncbi:hypothetical protein AB0F96_18895 [Streptomyces sp. NPDC023998]|uniref:hypothetical protein n=1 Tax=Streptomyces sp. NPDC023998 TaxID=3154597 RepID=UPI0034048C52
MAYRPTTAVRICPDCDGFDSVAITLGGRNRAGHLHTITAQCPACHGTGSRAARRRPLPAPAEVSA